MDAIAATDPETKVVADWLAENIGGQVVSIERQPRWRPPWIPHVDRGGDVVPLMIRGERYDTDMTWPLRHEGDFQKLMVDHGVAAPKVWGWIDKPLCFVMDRVPGSSWTIELPDAERETIVDEYVQELAKLHTLDIKPFVEAGIDHAKEGENP